eukprot:SAG31_NODE_47605_length_233_cov_5.067164_1_plen_34_part_10
MISQCHHALIPRFRQITAFRSAFLYGLLNRMEAA